jgi:predicted RecA/RadA family phage recombinase
MKNYTQPGNTLMLTAPYDVLSGGGALVGSIFGVSNYDVLTGEEGEFDVVGVFTLPKVNAQAWTQGALLYWDNTAKLATTVASGNKLIGTAAVVAANPSATGSVRLNGAFIS